MKKTLAILLSAVMMLGLLAGCGSKTTEQPSTSGTENTETAALNVGVFYYDYSDVYISSVRSSMDEQLKAMGVNYTNYDGAGNQAQHHDSRQENCKCLFHLSSSSRSLIIRSRWPSRLAVMMLLYRLPPEKAIEKTSLI